MAIQQFYIEAILNDPSKKWVLMEFAGVCSFYRLYSTRAEAYHDKKWYEINGKVVKARDFIEQFGTQEQKEKYKEIHNV